MGGGVGGGGVGVRGGQTAGGRGVGGTAAGGGLGGRWRRRLSGSMRSLGAVWRAGLGNSTALSCFSLSAAVLCSLGAAIAVPAISFQTLLLLRSPSTYSFCCGACTGGAGASTVRNRFVASCRCCLLLPSGLHAHCRSACCDLSFLNYYYIFSRWVYVSCVLLLVFYGLLLFPSLLHSLCEDVPGACHSCLLQAEQAAWEPLKGAWWRWTTKPGVAFGGHGDEVERA